MATANAPIFTCMACRVGFRDFDAQRAHYKTDWHRYNLKRKMADLMPITAVDFRNKVIQQAEARAAPAILVDDLKCVTCNKKFNSANAKASHMISKKHKEAVKRQSAAASKAAATAAATMGGMCPPCPDAAISATTAAATAPAAGATPASEADKTTVAVVPDADDLGTGMDSGGDEGDEGEVDPEDVDPDDLPEPEPDVVLTLEDCLFCSHRSESLAENLKHMNAAHGFYIPDVDYLVDLTGMIRYLGDKVSRYHMCLLCNGRGKAFHSTEAVRNHMCEKGHCFVEYDEQGQIELEEFYDFKPSWDAYYAKHGQPAAAAAAAAADDGDSDWEDVDEDDDGMETEGTPGPKQALVTTEEDKIEGQMVALYKAGRTVEIEGLDMVLPSGARIGHRSMRRYYKQKFATEDNRDSVVIQKLVSEHNAIGLPGFGSGAPTKEARRDRDQQTKYFHQQNFQRSIRGSSANIAYKYFREQNTQ